MSVGANASKVHNAIWRDLLCTRDIHPARFRGDIQRFVCTMNKGEKVIPTAHWALLQKWMFCCNVCPNSLEHEFLGIPSINVKFSPGLAYSVRIKSPKTIRCGLNWALNVETSNLTAVMSDFPSRVSLVFLNPGTRKQGQFFEKYYNRPSINRKKV